jgi:flagellar biogenesis protein FliO
VKLLLLFFLFCAAVLSAQAPAVAAQSEPRTGIGFRPDAAENGNLALRVGGALVIAVALALAALYGVRKFAPWLAAPAGRATKGGTLQLVESLRLSPRLNLLVVEFGAERILLASSEQGITVLARVAARGEPGA